MGFGFIAGVLRQRRTLRKHERWSRAALESHRAASLAELRRWASERSPFYRRFHAGRESRPLSELPVLTKTQLMECAVSVGIGLLVAVAAVAAFAHEGHTHVAPPKPTPEERAAFDAANPAFERNCFRCHTTAGKKSKRKAMQHLAMDTYPFGGHHVNEVGKVVRAALGMGSGGKATMPSDEPGTVAGEDLRLILAWADAFDRAHPAPATLDALPPVEQGHKR